MKLNSHDIADAITRGDFTTEQIKVIADAIRAAQTRASSNARRERYVGERVQFFARGRSYTGTVEKINTKNIKVLASDGRRWTVSPGLLSPTT